MFKTHYFNVTSTHVTWK